MEDTQLIIEVILTILEPLLLRPDSKENQNNKKSHHFDGIFLLVFSTPTPSTHLFSLAIRTHRYVRP